MKRRILFTVSILLLAASESQSAINLEWRPFEKIARPGEFVDIGLYAVSDNGLNQPISAMDVLLQWDASTLSLVGVVNNGSYSWFQSAFLPDGGLDGLNNSFADGDAKYTALAQFGNPAMATPAGILVTTVRFQAQVTTPLNNVTIPAMLGQSSHTAVYGTAFPGQNVTGTRGVAGVMICAGAADGDINLDGNGDGLDVASFVAAISQNSAAFSDVCHADFSGNKIVDANDIAGMVDKLLNG